MADTTNITEAIDKIIEEETFSASAVEGIKALRDKAADLEFEVKDLSDRLTAETKNSSAVETELSAFKGQQSVVAARESAVKEREEKITELEKGQAVSAARAETYKECVGLIFRNTEFKRSMFGQAPSGDGMISSINEDTTTKAE